MTATKQSDFEYLLDVDGVAGYSLRDGTLRVYCCDDMEDQVAAAVKEPVDVETTCIGKTLDEGDYVDALPEMEEPLERPGWHRPAPAGVSEIVHDSTAATASSIRCRSTTATSSNSDRFDSDDARRTPSARVRSLIHVR